MTLRDTIVGLMRCPTGAPKPCQACYNVADEILAVIEGALLSDAAVEAAAKAMWSYGDFEGVLSSKREEYRFALQAAIDHAR